VFIIGVFYGFFVCILIIRQFWSQRSPTTFIESTITYSKENRLFKKVVYDIKKFRKTFLTIELKKLEVEERRKIFTLNNSTILDFRVLIAGGGTGMNTLYIAEQLNHTNVSYPLIAILTFKYGIQVDLFNQSQHNCKHGAFQDFLTCNLFHTDQD